jgi:carbamoyltransferase
MPKPTYIIGTSLSHDGSACLLKDGRICFAIEKERITRRKHDGYNDAVAIEYCLRAANITLKDIDLIVQNTWAGMFAHGNEWFEGPRNFPTDVPVLTISHHLAHAYSAFATSSFTEASVLVIDNGGNSLDECLDLEEAEVPAKPDPELTPLYSEVDSFYHFTNDGYQTLFKDFSPLAMIRKPYPMYPKAVMHSIGGVYKAVSEYVFNNMDDPGKLMGLAPYGRPGVYDFQAFDLRDGRVFVRYDWQHHFGRPARSYDQFKNDFQYYADIAYWIQKEVERAILYTVQSRRALSKSSNLCYAGGVALNAVANRLILTQTDFENVYIQPAAGDNGISLGCAYYGWLKALGRKRVMHDGSTCFGAGYADDAIVSAIQEINASHLVQDSTDYISHAAELLASGKIVAWFQSGAEFGPRALGHRSILADPRRPEIRDYINRKVKFREDFRPFAPAVLAEDTNTYFDCSYKSPYMILVAPVREEWRHAIPSVTHLDFSARLQTVEEETDPDFYRLISEFKRLTDVGILLNTSFNKRGMPIVETPQQALDLFLNSAIDALVMNRVVLCKQ